jgi:NADPH2:quinone reductase
VRAVGYKTCLPIQHAEALLDIETPAPVPGPKDLLVEIRAVSVNPVDAKVRRGVAPEAGSAKILGWDAAGVVVATGSETSLFKAGDEVFYAGALTRPGTNAEFHVVDERLVGAKPRSLNWAESAAIPLTAITAWEALFDRLDVKRPVSGIAPSILIIGGAGGVGSMAIQLARQLTDLTIIATASRPETQDWVRSLGAHHVLDHSKPLAQEIAAQGLAAPSFVFCTTQTDQHLASIVELIAPQGRLCVIDDPATLDIMPFKRKSISVHWELMFTRSLFQTPDIQAQHALLNEVSRLVDAGAIRTTLSETLGKINAGNLKTAHALLESGSTKGKLVLEGF